MGSYAPNISRTNLFAEHMREFFSSRIAYINASQIIIPNAEQQSTLFYFPTLLILFVVTVLKPPGLVGVVVFIKLFCVF